MSRAFGEEVPSNDPFGSFLECFTRNFDATRGNVVFSFLFCSYAEVVPFALCVRIDAGSVDPCSVVGIISEADATANLFRVVCDFKV